MIAYWEKTFFTEIAVKFLGFLNLCIYALVRELCEIFTELSNLHLFGGDVIKNFTTRIYVILGIYMLFKLAISLLNSIINPDHLLDKEKGMQKIIPRTVLALGMLVLVPGVFNFALEKQETLARAVPKIIIGAGSIEDIGGQGEVLASTALKAFIIPNSQCGDGAAEEERNAVSSVQDVLDLPSRTCGNTEIPDYKKQFQFEFNGIISLAAGIFMVVSLASYCVDIAIRCIKLGLLQLLAPIPIISYIDPKSEKDGAFGHWVKESISTYVEVFIKLAILYFVIFILANIASDSGTLLGGLGEGSNASSASELAKVFIIIGAFFFMGKAAEFVCNIIGVKAPKEKGGFFKGLAGIAGLGATALSGLSRGITGAKAGVASANVREKGTASKIGAGVRGALAGTTTGLFAGAGAMINAKPGSNVAGTILGNTAKYNANKMALGEAGSTWLGRTKESMHRAFTGSSNFDKLKRQVKGEEDFVKMSKSFTSALKSEATKGKYGGVNLSGKNYAYENSISGTSKSLRAQAEIARSQGLADFYYHEIADDGSFLNTTKRISLDEVEVIASDLEKAEMQKGYAQLQAGTGQIVDGNPDLLASYQAVTAAAKTVPDVDVSTSKSLDDATKAVDARVTKVKNSREYSIGQINSDASKK